MSTRDIKQNGKIVGSVYTPNDPQPEPTIPDELEDFIAKLANGEYDTEESLRTALIKLIQTLEKKARADELEELRQLARVYCEKTVLIKILEITGSRLDCLKNLQTKQDEV